MRIVKLILYKFDRFLSGVDKFTYTPEKQFQMILGTNGSGKSSLLEELSPLPADIKGSFRQGGYKEIHIRHNDSDYILISGKDGANKHNFYKDGIELNSGNTKKIQLQLVFEHFRLTPDIFNVMVGKKNFTDMSVANRKDWFMSISPVDYQYAIGVFDKLKSKLRDYQGAVKLLNSKLDNLNTDLLPDSEATKLTNSFKAYDELYKLLLSLDTSHASDIEEFVKLIERREKLTSRIKDIDINELNVEKAKIETKIENLEKDIEIAKEAKEISELKEKEALVKSLDEVLKSVDNAPFDIKKLYKSKDSFKEAINSLGATISNYLGVSIDIDDYVDKLNSTGIKLNSLRTELQNTKTRLKEQELTNSNAEEVTCPNCKTEFKPGYNTNILSMLTSMEVKLKEDIDKIVEQGKVLETAINEYTTDKEIEKVIRETIVNLLLSIDGYTIYPSITDSNIKVELDNFKRFYRQYDNILTSEVIEAIEIRNMLKDRQLDGKKGSKSIEQLTKEHEELYSKLRDINSLIEEYKSNANIRKSIQDIDDTIIRLDVSTLVDRTEEAIANKNIKELLPTVEDIMSDIQDKIRADDLARLTIGQYKKDRDEYIEKIEVLNRMIKAISPKTGLIAKSLDSYIGKFVTYMNSYISELWSYELKILPPSVDNDLDYKFPIMVNGKVRDKSDVSLTSTGMKAIINIAFRLTSMSFLDMDRYPIYLDEFGENFDPEHKEQSMKFIEMLKDTKPSQIFAITHYESNMLSDRECDIVVLHNKNINSNIKGTNVVSTT